MAANSSSSARSTAFSRYSCVTGLMSLSRWTASTRGLSSCPAATCGATSARRTSGNVAKARRNPRKEAVRTGVRSLSTGGISPLLASGIPATLADMRCRLAVLVVALAGAGMLAAPAVAAESVATLELAPNDAAPAPKRFTLAGVHWRGTGNVAFRTRSLAGRWSAWRPGAPEDHDGPDVGSPEGRLRAGWRIGNPWWVGPSDRIQTRSIGKVSRVRAFLVWSPATRAPTRYRVPAITIDAAHRLAELLGRQRVDPARASAPTRRRSAA